MKLTREEIKNLWYSNPSITTTQLYRIVHCSRQRLHLELDILGITEQERKERGTSVRLAKLNETINNNPSKFMTSRFLITNTKPICPRCQILSEDGQLCDDCIYRLIKIL